MIESFRRAPRVAYFSMEIALRPDIPTYSGGLGVLAGDTLRSAADLDLPLVGVTLVSRKGYLRQEIDGYGRQIEHPDPWDPAQHCRGPLQAKVTVPVEGRPVSVGGWLYVVEGQLGRSLPVIMLDTDLQENTPPDREITHYLYGGDSVYRLKQEIVFGVGGVRMLHALGFRVSHYHMNEGHAALLTLELLRRHARPREGVRAGESQYDIPRVREQCNFTTHTPVAAGHDAFAHDVAQRVLGDFVDPAVLKSLAGEDALNLSRLALNLSGYVNAVAERHAEISRRLFPGYTIHAIANGVHPLTWTAPGFVAVYDRSLPGWSREPELLMRVDEIPDEILWQAHAQAKKALIAAVAARTGVNLRADEPILGFARRMTAYKRPDLLFSDLERLKRVARRWPFQVVLAGKAHRRDESGKRLIEALHAWMRELREIVPMAFVPNYDMTIARLMIAGADVWLNTPQRPLEASGTSGMKAAFNGVPSLSVLDGWWIEGCVPGITGWKVGESDESSGAGDADSLYRQLEEVVLPLYCDTVARSGWIAMMKGAISRNASYFNSHRMLRRYVSEAFGR